MTNCFLQIIIPCFNDVDNIKRLLNDIFNQSFTDFNVICVDDMSTDGTYEYIDSVRDVYGERLTVLRVDRKSYAGRTRNIGLSYAAENVNSVYTWMIDSDDRISDNAFQDIYDVITQDDRGHDIYYNTTQEYYGGVEPWWFIIKTGALYRRFSEIQSGNDRQWAYVQNKLVDDTLKKDLGKRVYMRMPYRTVYKNEELLMLISTLDLMLAEKQYGIAFDRPVNLHHILEIDGKFVIKFRENSILDHFKYQTMMNFIYDRYKDLEIIKNKGITYMVDSDTDIDGYSTAETRGILDTLGSSDYFIHNQLDGKKRSDVFMNYTPQYNVNYFSENLTSKIENRRNALVYAVNDDPHQLDMLQNSINSFCTHNKENLSSTDIIIITDKNIRLDRICHDAKDKVTVLRDVLYDYHKLPMRQRHTSYSYFRYEIFLNETFLKYDTILYVDTDTVFMNRCDLFDNNFISNQILMVPEHRSFIDQKKFHNKHYCNSGVICVSAKSIGRKKMLDLFIEQMFFIKKYDNFEKHDQDALNAVLALPENRHLLKPIGCIYNFNYATETDIHNDIIIRHYISQERYDLKYI